MEKATIPSGSRFAAIDGMRGISILMVVISHVLMVDIPFAFPGRQFLVMSFHGLLGVRLFFGISGFIITYILMMEYRGAGSVSLADFYKRRFVRLLPALYAFVALSAIVASFSKLGAPAARCVAASMAFAIGFVPNCGWDSAHLWSLTVEEIFYLAWPLLLTRGLRKRSVMVPLIGACVLSNAARLVDYLLARGYLARFAHWEHVHVFIHFDQIAVGACFAYWYVADKTRFESLYRLGHGTSRALAISLIVLSHAGSQPGPLSAPLFPFASLLLAFGTAWFMGSLVACPSGLWHAALSWKPLSGLGLLSYSLYLWQQVFFVSGGAFRSSVLAPLTSFPVNLAAMVAYAWLSYRFIEKPTQRLAHKWGLLSASRTPASPVPLKRAG